MLKDLNVRPYTIKLLEENISRTLFDINGKKYFLDPSPRIMKIKINKWDPIKLKSFGTVKQTIQKWKDNPWPGRKYLQMMQATKDCFPKYTNTKAHTAQYLKNKQPNQKMGRRPQ